MFYLNKLFILPGAFAISSETVADAVLPFVITLGNR